MSKAHRGNPLRSEGFLRGTCPITGRSGVKLLYDHNDEAGNAIKISKAAHAKFKNIKKEEARSKKDESPAEKPAPQKDKSPVETAPPVENADNSPTPEASSSEEAKKEEKVPEAEATADEKKDDTSEASEESK